MLSMQVNQIGKIISLYYYEAKATSFYFSVLQKAKKKKANPTPKKENNKPSKYMMTNKQRAWPITKNFLCIGIEMHLRPLKIYFALQRESYS